MNLHTVLSRLTARPVNQVVAGCFALVALLPVVIITYSLYQASWDDAWREVNEKHRLLAINLAAPLAVHVQDHEQMLGMTANQIASYYRNGIADHPNVQQLLDVSLNSFSGFENLALVDNDMQLVGLANRGGVRPSTQDDLGRLPCLSQAASTRKHVVTGITSNLAAQNPTIQICQPVIDYDNRLLGVLLGELDIGVIERLRKNVFFGRGGHSAIVDQTGRVIAHPNPEWMKEMRDLSDWTIVQEMKSGKNGVGEFFSPFTKMQMVAGYAAVHGIGWGIMVPQPRAEIESQVNQLLLSTYAGGGFALALAVVCAIALARWITGPINRLALAAERLVQHGFQGKLPLSEWAAPREVQQLSGVLGALTNGFQQSQKEVRLLNSELQERIDQATRRLRDANLHLEHMATRDELTGLPNRRGIQELIEREHARAQRHRRPYSVLLCDLDRFKLINDNYGHGAGDQVLSRIASQAPSALRDGDAVGRWGGEEFLCLLVDTDREEAMQVAERLRTHVASTMHLTDALEIQTTISVGVATYPEDGDRIDTLLSCADAALYEAKRAGRNRVVCSRGKTYGVFSIAGQIQSALNLGRLRPAYQPIVDLISGKVVAEETLARIDGGERGYLEASSFIEAAHQLQMVHRIDYELISQSIRRSGDESLGDPVMRFVNISTDLLRHPELIERLVDELKVLCDNERCSLHGQKPLVIEITEREFLGQTNEARRLLRPFLDLGLTLALDDFGSGYSSFRYLADLPIKYLKIEGELVKRASHESKVRSVIQAIQDTAQSLGVTTLAEGVEDERTLQLLRTVGIDLAQGYYFGRPVVA